ncbi:MAG: FAD-dependent oxidoreductase [Phycisphaerales bacterium]
MSEAGPIQLDVVIFGGGGAGLWLLDELVRRNFSVLLLEANELGNGQTIASQGIIHGGLKYTLSGLMTPSASAIRDMPGVWRTCLTGDREPQLTATRLRAECCHLWQTASLKSRLGMAGARAGLRVVPQKLDDDERPAVLRSCPGVVVKLDEQVIDPASFVSDLAWRHRRHLLHIDTEDGLDFDQADDGDVSCLRLKNPKSGDGLALAPRNVVLTAGAGNADLRRRAGLLAEVMQRRPLHMVMLRGELPSLNGHCVDGASTRVTITTASDSSGRAVWQVGGRIAENGVDLEPKQLVAHARKEIQSVLPGIELREVQWSTYRIDRAEAAAAGRRPEDVSIIHDGNVITAWPTKLALVPKLAESIVSVLGEPGATEEDYLHGVAPWPRPEVALAPWETTQQWFDEV